MIPSLSKVTEEGIRIRLERYGVAKENADLLIRFLVSMVVDRSELRTYLKSKRKNESWHGSELSIVLGEIYNETYQDLAWQIGH